jgi:putative transposase
VAVIDWFSRFVLAWQLSNTLDGAFCLAALQLAFQLGRPDIFNTDQGAQLTAYDFTDNPEAEGVRISMDGRGRAFDNIFVERLWRAVKCEDSYLKECETMPALEVGLTRYFHFYNQQRQRQSLQSRVPAEVDLGC